MVQVPSLSDLRFRRCGHVVTETIGFVILGRHRHVIRWNVRWVPYRLGRGLRTTGHLRMDTGRYGTAISASLRGMVVEIGWVECRSFSGIFGDGVKLANGEDGRSDYRGIIGRP